MKIIRKIKYCICNDIICISSIISSLIITFSLFGYFNPFFNSLSRVGRNHYIVYILWCIVTSFTLFVNIIRMYDITKFKSKIGLIISWLGLISFYISLYYLNYTNDLEALLHIIFAFTFSGLISLSILICLIYIMIKYKRYRFFIITSLIILLLDLYIIITCNYTSFMSEFIPLLIAYIIFIIIIKDKKSFNKKSS